MEAIGGIASILSICEGVLGCIKFAREWSRAAADIERLQEEVEEFRDYLQAVEAIGTITPAVVLHGALHKARKSIDELHNLVTTKLVPRRNGVLQFRQSAWLKHRQKLSRLRKTLEVAREGLVKAMILDILESVHGRTGTTAHYREGPRAIRAARRFENEVASSHAFPSSTSPRQTHSHLLDTLVMRVSDPLTEAKSLGGTPPESYTIRDDTPALYAVSNREMSSCEYTRATECALFFSKRHAWLRLTVTVLTTVDSPYWTLERASSDELTKFDRDLRLSYIPSVLEFLGRQSVEQDAHLSLYQSQNTYINCGRYIPRQSIKLTRPSPQLIACMEKISNMLLHLNCPEFAEQQLVHRPLFGAHFVANLNDRWTYERRFSSAPAQIDHTLYNLQAFSCLRGSPGISPFVGIVRDAMSRTVTAYLAELPAKGTLTFAMHNAEEPGKLVSLGLRIKWCKQIVQGVAEFHRRGFVLGCLGFTPSCGVGVDSNDNAVFYCELRKSFRHESHVAGVTPPECAVELPSSEEYQVTEIPALPQTDIYQLGWLIWRIVSNTHILSRQTCCKLAGCSEPGGVVCRAPHGDPVQLPPPGVEVPEYVMEIIAACRARDPQERPPAWKILQMFPLMVEAAQPGTQPPTPLERLEDCIRAFARVTLCDLCCQWCNDVAYSCDSCNRGNFDICPACFESGEHCARADHYLCKKSAGGRDIEFFSAPREDGHRDVQIRDYMQGPAAIRGA